jgi:hypothetical protein
MTTVMICLNALLLQVFGTMIIMIAFLFVQKSCSTKQFVQLSLASASYEFASNPARDIFFAIVGPPEDCIM